MLFTTNENLMKHWNYINAHFRSVKMMSMSFSEFTSLKKIFSTIKSSKRLMIATKNVTTKKHWNYTIVAKLLEKMINTLQK